MAISLDKRIADILGSTKEDSATLFAKAFKMGIHKMWADMVLERYLTGKLSRKKAISLVGLDLVKLAEKQKKACLEDISWGLSGS